MPSILGNGTSALLAFQRALATTSHNVANAATEGYSRQRVEFANRPTERFGAGYVGAGVTINDVSRFSDSLLNGRLLDSGGELGRLQQTSAFASRIDALFTDTTTGLAGPWSGFFDAAQSLAAQPASQAARRELLSRAEALVARFDLLDKGLQQVDDEIDALLIGGSEEVNRLTDEVVRLNREITRNGIERAPPDLLDQRDLVVKRLATLTGVTTLPQDDGALNVFTLGGQPLVVGTNASRFEAVVDDYRPDRNVLVLSTPNGVVRLGPGAVAGQMGAAIEARDTMIDAFRAELGRTAAGLADAVNAVSAAGLDLNGNTGTDFFTLPQPAASSNRNNTGTATLGITRANLAQLTGVPFVLRFDGVGWSANRADDGRPMTLTGTGTVADPLVIDGIEVVVSGTPGVNDRFRVEPTGAAAREIAVAINDPNRIAAASRVRGSAELANLGSGRVVSLTVDDATDPLLTTAVSITFLTGNTFSVDGGPPQAYTPGGTISVNGWSLVLDGLPRTGDTFRVGANVAGSSDNTNMRAWARLDEARLLGNGANSLNDTIGGLTTRIGSIAREASMGAESQAVINDGLVKDREALAGVNLDEEAANLLRFQQAYQAAAQVVATADTLFQSLLAAVRR